MYRLDGQKWELQERYEFLINAFSNFKCLKSSLVFPFDFACYRFVHSEVYVNIFHWSEK